MRWTSPDDGWGTHLIPSAYFSDPILWFVLSNLLKIEPVFNRNVIGSSWVFGILLKSWLLLTDARILFKDKIGMEVDCTWHTSFLGFGEDANGHASDCGSPREMKHLDTTCWILFPFQSSVIGAWDQSTLIGPRYHSTYFTSTLGGRTGWLSFPRLHASGEIIGFLFSGGGLSEKDRRLLKTVDTTTSSDMYSDVL